MDNQTNQIKEKNIVVPEAFTFCYMDYVVRHALDFVYGSIHYDTCQRIKGESAMYLVLTSFHKVVGVVELCPLPEHCRVTVFSGDIDRDFIDAEISLSDAHLFEDFLYSEAA